MACGRPVADRVHGPQTGADAGQVPIPADRSALPGDGRVYHGHAARDGRADQILLLLLRKPESLAAREDLRLHDNTSTGGAVGRSTSKLTGTWVIQQLYGPGLL